METLDAIRHMIERSGVNASELSRRMGKSRNHWGVTFAKGSTPKASTLADAAHVMGYRLMLAGHGEDIEIDGGEQDADSDQGSADQRGDTRTS